MEQFLVDIEKIVADENQPRKFFDEEELNELAKSIILHGLLQNILVRREKDKYVIVAGERRYRACQIAGLREIPVNIVEDDDYQIISLIENIQRAELSPIEEGEAIKNLMKAKDYTQEEVARVLGKTRSYISNKLRVLSLSDPCKEIFSNYNLKEGHARAILSLKSKKKQKELAEIIAKKGLNVTEAENLAKEMKNNKTKPKNKKTDKFSDAVIEELEEKLGTKVRLETRNNEKFLAIYYYDNEDLESLIDFLTSKEEK